MSEQEYEVETICRARVAKKTPRSKVLIWQYLVKWKGYDSKDNTWEPVESFEGSEHIISNFWARVPHLSGRDVRDLSSFRFGEEFFPEGPPGRSTRLQSSLASTFLDAKESSLNQKRTKRKRSPEPQTRTKRTKAVNSISQIQSPVSPDNHSAVPPITSLRNTNRQLRIRISPEIIPATDDEQTPTPSNPQETNSEHNSVSPITNIPILPDTDKLPAHRLREANPLVRMADDFAAMDDAIPAKVRASRKGSNLLEQSPAKRRKPGPGRSSIGMLDPNRSSLLTFNKGTLKTVKGDYSSLLDEADNEPSSTADLASSSEPQLKEVDVQPSGEELLTLGGLKGDEPITLDDFEDVEADEQEPSMENSIFRKSFVLAKNALFPAIASSVSDAFSWKRPTIFGPLGIGSDSVSGKSGNIQSQTASYSLCISASAVVPIDFLEISSSANGSSSLVQVVEESRKFASTPGKFYQSEITSSLVNTLRTGGSTALVVTSANSDKFHQEQFNRFQNDLDSGKLFIGMAGLAVLIYCSSNNSAISQRLNLPVSLSMRPDSVLVSHVTIEDLSAYASLTDQALDACW